jgi:predicted short-subunit dehydrogenase-like oxidoreductase (DUF2520 family)
MMRVAILGAGRVGTSLGAALRRAGHSVRAVTCRRPASARQSARLIGRTSAFPSNARAAEAADLIFLCLPDAAIGAAAKALAAEVKDLTGKVVFHTSGALPAAALSPLRKKGARIASFHPAQAFARKDREDGMFAGVTIALEGDPGALAVGRRIVRSLGARPLILNARQKAAFHAACTIVSNYLIALFAMAGEALRGTGIARRDALAALTVLAKGTLRNVNNIDAVRALTGPLARGDLDTVARHLRVLGRAPLHERAYAALGLVALDLAARRGLPPSRVRSARRLLEGKRPLPRARRRTGS